MKKIKKVALVIMCLLMLMSNSSFANEAYEQKIIETYGLSDRAVEFMREHNVDFSVFEGAEIYPEDHPKNYNRDIEGLIAQAQAYGFTDEQIQAYINGSINSKMVIIGGPYDNTGRKKVVVPDYPFVINGQTIEYKNSEYPVISYNDVTYFPMTWHYCRMLGVITDWNESTGLSITKGKTEVQKPEYGEKNNSQELYASQPEYDIYVNGNRIENQSEEYPFLNFRNVTYFPMTWDFMVNELGWRYTLDSLNGLVIVSDENKFVYSSVQPETLTFNIKKGTELPKFTFYSLGESHNLTFSILDKSDSAVIYQSEMTVLESKYPQELSLSLDKKLLSDKEYCVQLSAISKENGCGMFEITETMPEKR